MRAKRAKSTNKGRTGAGTRPPTAYEVFRRDEGGVLWPLGFTEANKPEQAKRALGGDVAIPCRSLR